MMKTIISIFVFGLLLPISFKTQAALYTLHSPQDHLLSSESLHIFACGTGDPEPGMQALRKPSCLAVIGNGNFLLFDAGEGSIQTLAALGLPIDKLNNVFITHWHSDHFGGLGQVINESWIRGRQKSIHVFGPNGVNNIINGLSQAYLLDTKFRVINRQGKLKAKYAVATPHLITASKNNQPLYQSNGIHVTAFPVNHKPAQPALGYKIQFKGCKIVISGDTKIVDSLAKQAKDADALISESISRPLYQKEIERAKNSKNAEKEIAYTKQSYHYHSDSWELAKMANTANVKNLFITHLVPAIGTSTSMKQAFIEGMEKYYKKPITVLNDRDEIIVTPHKNGECQIRLLSASQSKIKIVPIPIH